MSSPDLPSPDRPTPDLDRKANRSRKNKGRRARGTGSIFWHEGRQQYVGRKIVGRAAGGKPLYREVSAETKEKVVRLLAEVGPAGANVTVAAWAVRWLAGLSVRQSTRENYANSINNHIVPALGHLRVADVAPSRVKALVAALGEKFEPSTVVKVFTHGRALFDGARLDQVRPDNPFALVRRPKGSKKKIDPFTPAELKRIAGADTTLSAGGLVAVLAATGCRLGEGSALDVADWDPVAGKITISKTYHSKFGLGPPKSENGNRTLTVPAVAHAALNAAAAGRASGPLFRTKKGNHFTKPQVQLTFKTILGRLGLPSRNLHQLRHSVATALIAANHPIADVAVYLGDSVDTIVKTYIHPSGADAGVTLGKIFGG